MLTNLRQTVFEVEPLKSVVNVGSSTAYYICVMPGKSLGTVGAIKDFANEFAGMDAMNETEFNTACARPGKKDASCSWFGRVLATLGR